MKTSCFAVLLLCAAAAGAQSQSTQPTQQAQAPAAGAQSQAAAPPGQATSCGIACSVGPNATSNPGYPATPKPPANLAKLAANKSDLDRVVCEAEDTLGTRLGAKKVCMTVSQWIEFENDVKDQTRRIEILGKVSN
jgi:hypothetical protein